MTDSPVMLITGTSRGIGRALAEYYLVRGWTVYGCSRKKADLRDPHYRHFELSVSDENKVKGMFAALRKREGRLDVLVNNAGIASMNHSMLTSMATAEAILNTNVLGPFLFSREAVKIMKKKRFGRIVNFATFAVPFKLEGEAIYAASKAAVLSLTEILAREYADFGVTVNAVAPPAVQTDLVAGIADDKMQELLQRQAIHRFGRPEEVARVIDFFISPDNDMVTGQTVYLGGV